MESNLANTNWQVPVNSTKLRGEPRQRGMPIRRQPRNGQPGQRSKELSEGRVGPNELPLQTTVKPEECVPTPIGSEVPGEHEQAEGRLLRPIKESEHPDLRVKDVAGSWPSHLVDNVLKQRQQIGWPPLSADGPRLAEDVEPFTH